MKRVKVKKLNAISKEDTEMLGQMFEQMTGMSDADTDIIIPKYTNVMLLIVKYIKIFGILTSFSEYENIEEIAMWFSEIKKFTSLLSKEADINTDYESASFYKSLIEMEQTELNEKYKKIKESGDIKNIIITTSNLSPYKKYISDKGNLSDLFIKNEPGYVLIPFSFSNFDLQFIWNNDQINEKYKKIVLSVIHHSYKIGMELFELISSPDIDIKRFSGVLVESLSKLRREIPNCNKAFDAIENSVKLLEDNFGTYYKSSIESENPSVIIENFILDVSTSKKTSAVTTGQFRRIVDHLKKKSSHISNPKIKMLFNLLNNQFDNINEEMKKEGISEADEDLEEEKGEKEKEKELDAELEKKESDSPNETV
jgi:hypothetical protein